jgi:hypothetical protein
MSFEVYVQCFKDGESGVVPCQQVRDAFGSFLTETGPSRWQLYYGMGDCCDVRLTVDDKDKTLLHGFTVERPCSDERLWDALTSILTLGNLVLFIPADCPPFVGDNRVAQHLPPDMIEGMGQPKCVTTGKELLDALDAV